ncbi:endospore germination permease [Paenibacillus sp. PL91]|uniref:GerAB/ArcD/ProY family transporter n=1 Tax=Paenibacillus sp. PL91 TaxID=2729538 RepID=UPI00145E22CD|nr:endospore germination permease [Paenibacillus sp. PL91]MBC9202056.1 endospore germination permease [Paenibacillus sp. PL91]
MERRITISNFQMMSLIVISTIGTSSLYAPATFAHYAERNSWYLVVTGGIMGLLNLFIFLKLNQLYPNKNLISICTHLLGPWLGKGLAFLFIFFFLDLSSWILREFAQFFIIALNPVIPQFWYLAAGAIMCAYAVYHGLEVFARVSEIILFVTVTTFLAIYLLLINQYHPEYLLPVLEDGLIQPLKGLMLSMSWFGDLMFISMMIQHVRKTKHTTAYAMGAVGITFLLLLMSVLSCTMLFGGQTTASFTYPSISLIQNIKLFRNIERFDAALIVVWVMSSFIKITVYFWSALHGLSHLLRLRQPRWFIIPMAIGFVIISRFKVWGLIELSAFYDDHAWYFVLFQLFIPAGLLFIAWIKENMAKSR